MPSAGGKSEPYENARLEKDLCGELAVVQFRVEAAFLKQFFMSALFHHIARVHDQNHIRVLDSRQTVCHDETGASVHQLLESPLNTLLRPGIDG